MKSINCKELSAHMVSVDSYEIIKDNNGFPTLIDCWCYIEGLEDILNGQYEHKIIPFTSLEIFNIQNDIWDTIEEYFQEESNIMICSDLEQIINKSEGRTYKIQKKEPDFPGSEIFSNALK